MSTFTLTLERTVVLAEQRMEPALAQLARDACQRAGAECRDASSAGRMDDLAERAVLAIGALPGGTRRIPSDLAGLVTEQIPGLPLLLLADEPLVRPVVVMQDGLVTLIESPPSIERLTGCVRALLAENPPQAAGQSGWWRPLASEADGFRREYRVGPHWIGVLEGERVPGRPAHAPAAWLRIGDGVTALINDSADAPPRSGDGDFDAASAVVQLETTGDRPDWVFLAPRGRAALGLFSPQRLPTFTNLSRTGATGDAGPRRMAAAAGDIAVALAPADAWGDVTATIGHDLSDGGAAFLDRLEVHMRRAPVLSSCVVIEVR